MFFLYKIFFVNCIKNGSAMNDFLCPHCGCHIRVGDHIIFRVKNRKGQNAILLLSPQVGNYSSIKHPSFEYAPGEKIDFFCPACSKSLKSDIHENLARLHMIDEAGKQFDVYFSQVAGEHSTYKTDGVTVLAAGEDAGKYTYFKFEEKFKKFL